MQDRFAEKLAFITKALSLSRGRLGAEMGVDKSVVSRWLSGARAPSPTNMEALTALVARRRPALEPAFSLLDWELDIPELAAKFGLAHAEAQAGLQAMGEWLPGAVIRENRAATAARGEAFEGFWRSTRPSNEFPGRFVHDRILIRKGADGMLKLRVAVIDMRFEGVLFLSQTQVFGLCADAASGVFIFLILNGVTRQRADVLDGLTLTCQRIQGGTPVAAAVVVERTGHLGDDPETDDARFEASVSANPFASETSAPTAVRERLLRDVGPTAMANGGEALLTMAFATSLSRGPDPRATFPE